LIARLLAHQSDAVDGDGENGGGLDDEEVTELPEDSNDALPAGEAEAEQAETSADTTTTTPSVDMTDAQRRAARAEKFGTVSDAEKAARRAKRFGLDKSVAGKSKAGKSALSEEALMKLKSRAERFGTVTAKPLKAAEKAQQRADAIEARKAARAAALDKKQEDEARKKARFDRFAIGAGGTPASEAELAKRKARQERFG